MHETILDGIGKVEVLDSPGLDVNENELPYIERIINESDTIIMVVDHKAGLNSKDEEMISMVRRAGKISQMIVFINKLDKKPNENQMALISSEYSHWGIDHLVFGSAHHGKTGDLMRLLYTMLGTQEQALSSSF